MQKIVRKNEVGNLITYIGDDGKVLMYDDAAPTSQSEAPDTMQIVDR